MLIFSYRNCVRLLRTVPICPKPRAIGLTNIPRSEPALFVYNHVARRTEPLYLAMAAPPDPAIRFFIELTLVGPDLFERTLRDVRNAVFSYGFQKRAERRPLMRKIMERSSLLLTRFLIAQMKRLNFIPVYLHDPPTPEERARKARINRQALDSCLESLAERVSVAIAPRGGSSYEGADNSVIPTTIPSLAEILRRKGIVLKIVPCVIKERPEINKDSYAKYVADRVLPYRLFRELPDKLGIRPYRRPRLTVEFLPAVTFAAAPATKAEKARFVQDLQRMLYDVLNRD